MQTVNEFIAELEEFLTDVKNDPESYKHLGVDGIAQECLIDIAQFKGYQRVDNKDDNEAFYEAYKSEI